jgi:hypothetical protein
MHGPDAHTDATLQRRTFFWKSKIPDVTCIETPGRRWKILTTGCEAMAAQLNTWTEHTADATHSRDPSRSSGNRNAMPVLHRTRGVAEDGLTRAGCDYGAHGNAWRFTTDATLQPESRSSCRTKPKATSNAASKHRRQHWI